MLLLLPLHCLMLVTSFLLLKILRIKYVFHEISKFFLFLLVLFFIINTNTTTDTTAFTTSAFSTTTTVTATPENVQEP